jgi:hypothetical protein
MVSLLPDGIGDFALYFLLALAVRSGHGEMRKPRSMPEQLGDAESRHLLSRGTNTRMRLSPLTQGLVGSEDHRPFSEVTIIDYMEQNVGGVLPVGQVANLLNHMHLAPVSIPRSVASPRCSIVVAGAQPKPLCLCVVLLILAGWCPSPAPSGHLFRVSTCGSMALTYPLVQTAIGVRLPIDHKDNRIPTIELLLYLE